MEFKSLFIGVNEYKSPLISNLSCCVRDAQALYALFCDSFGDDNSILLTDKEATRESILRNIRALHVCAPDDTVVIYFSGHGSDSHHLISYDADPLSLDTTAIHLDELTTLFLEIPARNLVLLLDCCFAGGAGAKVFHAPIATKASSSAEMLLSQISGSGRLILTAAAADQEAIEVRRLGHSLFTFYVLEALKGAPEVVRSGAVPILGMIEFVTRSVVSTAGQWRHKQEPTMRGSIEGELVFPLLAPGPIYRSYFHDHSGVTTTAHVKDLLNFGFAPQVIEIWKGSISTLNELQQDAINRAGLFQGQHLVVSAPTSSGKTMIGELAALHAQSRGERSYMLFPLRALVNDKYDEFTLKYGRFGLRVIRSTGEIADDNDALIRGKFDVALLTYERFAALAVTLPHILRQVSVIVIDEVQMITDKNRGANLEFVLTLLKSQRLYGIEPQLIALSAVIGDANGFESWLGGRLLKTTKRPVPLDEGMIDMSGTFRYLDTEGNEQTIPTYVSPEFRKGSSQDVIIPLVRKLVAGGEKVIVFRETKPIVRATAEYLKANLGLPPARETLERMPSGDPSAASEQLRRCLAHGIAFHNADLDREERQAIESTFRDPNSSLKVLVATTTLAMGVNTPAWSVVIAGLEHPDSSYTVAEYKNMVGRAGRLGFTPKGKSFLVASNGSEEYKFWNHYVLGEPEGLSSRFAALEPLSLICRVLATAKAARTEGLTQPDLLAFIQSTFASYQQHQVLAPVEIADAIHRLRGAGLIDSADDRYRLTPLGSAAGELGIQVESVVRIARALRGLCPSDLASRVLLAAAQVSEELDEVLFPIHKRSIQERQRWHNAVHQQRLPASVMSEINSAIGDATVTARCKKLSCVLMWTEGVELGRLEASLLQHLPGDNAAGPIRATAERTRDLIGVVARIGALVTSGDPHSGIDIDDLALQLELGIPQEIVWLARETKRGLDRSDYLALRKASLTTLDALVRGDERELMRVLPSPVKRARIREALVKVAERQKPVLGELPMPTAPT
jgi:helicase